MGEGWIVEVCRNGLGFVTHATGYETKAKAKLAAARAFRSSVFARRVRVVYEGDPVEMYETLFRPGERAKWWPTSHQFIRGESDDSSNG